MNAPVILYRHPEGMGSIVADSTHARLIVSSADEESTITVSIGPAGLRALAARLRETADRIERRERGERAK